MIALLLNLFQSLLSWAPAVAPAVPPAGPVMLSMEAVSWNITYSPTMPAHPAAAGGGAWFLDIPIGPDGQAAWSAPVIPAVHYVTLPVALNLSGRKSLTASFRLETSGEPVFQFKLKPDNVCLAPPASVSLFLQRAGDDMSGAGAMEFYRWWSQPISWVLADGIATLIVPLTSDQWVSVMGKMGNADATATAGFQSALANLSNIGLTFGGGCFKGHGVNISDGTARFTVFSFSAD
jgi:hypothetical protein